MNKKGQTAFEALFLFIIVLSAAIVIISGYTQTQDDTTALLITRAQTNNQLANIKENIIIDEIKLTKTANYTDININLTPNFDLNKNAIKLAIENETSFKNIRINVE